MERIPIYDATAPVACTIGDGEIDDRLALLTRMRDALTGLDRTEHGLVLRFPADPAVESDVRQFALDEKRCCQFWGFEVEADGASVSLRWDGPPAAAGVLGRIEAILAGAAPVEGLRELL